MTPQNDPMPLRDLPAYIESARKNGQSEEVPVVGMGQIVVSKESSDWPRKLAFAASVCLFLTASSMLAYAVGAAKNITVASTNKDMGSEEVREMVEKGGGRVISVKQNEDKTYNVRVLTLRSVGSFLESLRKNKDLKVDAQ
jgi:hypothetical protein